MAEREARVIAIESGRWHLRLLGTACRGCTIGCAGHCRIFGGEAADALTMVADGRAQVGDLVVLRLDDGALRRAAWLGYGRVLLGLLLGATAGYGIGIGVGHAVDFFTLFGLLCGTFLAVRFSKRLAIEPKLSFPPFQ